MLLIHKHNRRAGFTMIEVVAAIVILSVAILPLAQVFYIGTKVVNLVKEDSELLFTSGSAAEIYLSQDLFTPFMVFPEESNFFDKNKFQITSQSESESNISPTGTLWINRITIEQKPAAGAGSRPKAKSINSLHTSAIQSKTLARSQRKYITGYKEKILKK